MQNKIRTIVAMAAGTLFFPISVFAQGWTLTNTYGLPQGSIYGILYYFLFWLLAIFAILGIIGFVISGIFYLVSAGDDGMIEKGKAGMKYSILGIIVGLSGYLIMQAVTIFLGGATNNF